MEQSPQETPDHQTKKPAYYLSIGRMSLIWLITLFVGSAVMVLSDRQAIAGDKITDAIGIVFLFTGLNGLMSLVLWAVFIMLLEGLNEKTRAFPKYVLWLNVWFVLVCVIYGILLVGLMRDISVVIRFYLPDVFLGILLLNAQVFHQKKKAERAAA